MTNEITFPATYVVRNPVRLVTDSLFITNPCIPACQSNRRDRSCACYSASRGTSEDKDGYLIIHKDITFTDPDGDAITVVNKVVSAMRPDKVMDDIIRIPPDEQKGEALVTSSFGCGMQFQLVMEYRIYDKAGNMSEPVTATFSCPAPKNRISPSLIVGLVIGLGLFVGLWLLVRSCRSRRARVSRP